MTSSHECPNAKLISQLLLPMILAVLMIGALFLILGGLFGVLGALLVYLGTRGTAHIASFGQGLEIADVGILSLFIAGIVVVMTLQRVLKSLDEFNNRQGLNFLRR